MSEPPRRRVAIPSESRESSERRSFFRIAAILGVLVGIPVGVFGLPALLNVFLDEPTIPPGGAWTDGGLILWVESWEIDDGPPRSVVVTLALRTTEGWTMNLDGVELELSKGDPIVLEVLGEPLVLAAGEAKISLPFILIEAEDGAEPQAVRFRDPKVRFELVESDH